MAGPALPTNVDTTYDDDVADGSVKIHQQAHDAIHGIVNRFDKDATPSTNTVPVFNGTVYVPASIYTIPVTAATYTSSRTLALGDAGTVVEMNSAAAVNVTVPPNSAVAFPVGTFIEIYQMGAGAATLVAGAGVTLRTVGTLTTRTQYATVALRKRATDEWVVSGDLA